MPKRAKALPLTLIENLKSVDLIIHAGDWQTLDVYHQLCEFAPVEGVYGNVDDEPVRNQFEKNLVIEVGNVTIGITHGGGKNKTTEKRALDQMEYENVDILIYGHSHIPVVKEIGDMLLFNPGSATDKRRQSHFSFGLINVGDTVLCRHVFYDSKE